jgi:hypothetical protein
LSNFVNPKYVSVYHTVGTKSNRPMPAWSRLER